jgi:tetratricopeptide (TPR) repeat protein
MMKKLTLILTLIGGGFGAAQQKVSEADEWKAALGSSDFKKRFEASTAIWTAGDRAIEFLNELAEGDDPEVAARAINLSLRIRSGISPETPEATVELVNRFFASNTNARAKIGILEELQRLEEFGFIFRLKNLENDEEVVEKAEEIIEGVLPHLVRKLTSEGSFEEVKSLLLLGKEFSTMIAYANLLESLGELDAEIAKLRELDSPEDRVRYLACLRVKGDARLLRDEAGRIGDQEGVALGGLLLGDHVPYFEYLAANEDLNLSARHYLNWSLAMAKGDLTRANEIKAALVHLTKDKSEMAYARMNLFRMGFPAEVVSGFAPDEVDYLHTYYLGQEDYLRVLPLLGMPDGKLTDDWLKQRSDEFRVGIDQSEGSSQFFYAADFFERRGQIDDAVRCYSAMFEVIRGSKTKKLSTWYPTAFIYGPQATIRVLAREVEDYDYDLSLVIENLFDSDGVYDWLHVQLDELYPDATVEEMLFLIASFGDVSGSGSGHNLFVSEKRFEEVHKRLIGHVLKSAEKVSGLNNLYALARSRDSEKDILNLEGLLEKEGQEFTNFDRGAFAAQQMNFEQAGKYFKETELDEKEASIYRIYEKGVALRRAGLPGAEELCQKALQFSQGSARDLENFAATERQFGFNDEAYVLTQKALLRLNISGDDSRGMSSSYWIINGLATGAIERKQWDQAVAFREAVAWETNTGRSIQTLRARFQILLAQGARSMKKGEIIQAARYFTEAHRLIPRDGYLANDFFPLVRELGLVELHDQLFAESARYCREVIRNYPGDDNALNNFAWMASRANRCLDEAEGYLKKALEMKPRSAAYLDTMGEIYFARKNREEAIRWSNLSRSYEISDVELQGQNRRFREGPFPAP